MPTIKSDIVNKNIQNSQSLRQFEVSDESETVYNPPPPQNYNQNSNDIDSINELLTSRGFPPMTAQSPPIPQTPQTYQTSQNYSNVESNIKEIRKQKLSGKERLSSAAKSRIDLLCGFSKNLKTLNIDGNSYVLRTLKSKELREAAVFASNIENNLQANLELRNQLLARSLVKICDMEVILFLGDDSLEARLEFLEEIDDNLLQELHSNYEVLVREVQNRYSIQKDEVVKEVMEDLKK